MILGSLIDNDQNSFVLDVNGDVARRVVVTETVGGAGGSLTDAELRASPVVSKEVRQATATTSNVASSGASVTLLASNSSRLSASFFNDSTKDLYLKHGSTATTSSFTVLIQAKGFYELPFPCYNGIVTGLWSAVNGNCRVTEGIA